MKVKKKEPRFRLGRVFATPEAMRTLESEGTDTREFLDRHRQGDWGDVCREDKEANEYAITEGLRILSAYKLPVTGEKLWIITEADRSSTTLLLPNEY